jgi:hypothetical protein
LVEERTADYLEEKRKCEELLYQLLPKWVQLILSYYKTIFERFNYYDTSSDVIVYNITNKRWPNVVNKIIMHFNQSRGFIIITLNDGKNVSLEVPCHLF